MKQLHQTIFVFVMLMVIVGCSTKAPGTTAPPSADSNKTEEGEGATVQTGQEGPVTLKLGGIEYQYTEAVIDAFEKKNPNIKIEFTAGNTSFEDGSIQALLRSGTGPDVLNVSSGPGRVGLLSDSGLIRSIDDIMEKYDIESRYQPWVIEQTRTQGKGKVYELVEGVDVFSVYYNKQMFEQNGLELPKSWEEFLDICEKLKNAGIQPITAGFRKGIGGGWMLGNLIESSAGKDRMTEVIYGDGKFDQPEIILGGEMLKQLVDRGYVDGKAALALDQSQAQAELLNEKAAMTISPQGFIAAARREGTDVSKFDSFVLPSREEGRPGRPSAGLAHSWVVNINAPKEKLFAIEKWLEWLSSEEYLTIAAANGGSLVPVINAAGNIKHDPAIEVANELLKNGAGYNPSVYLPAKAKDAWYAAAEGIVAGTMTPTEAMQMVEAALSQEKQAK